MSEGETIRGKQSNLPGSPFGGRTFMEYIRAPAFKRLLNQIYLAQEKEGFKSVAVLSERPQEGKTFFISALALGYARFLKRRVLIMDTISQTRNESFYIGTIMEEEQKAQEDAIEPIIGSIDLITTRNLQREIRRAQSPDGFVEEEEEDFDTADFQIGSFIDEILPNYDLVLLDTCALEQVTTNHLDPVILAKQAHRAILVVTSDALQRSTLDQITKELRRAEVRLLGVVGNRIPGREEKR